MTPAVLVMSLALIWSVATGNFSGPNLLFGAAIGGVAVFLLRDTLASRAGLRRTRRLVSLTALFLCELLLSAIRVAVLVVRPDLGSVLRPAIVAVPLTVRSDIEITMLANLITLTPGTLSVDVSEDRKTLYVHVLHLDDRDALILDIKSGFERKVMEVFE